MHALNLRDNFVFMYKGAGRIEVSKISFSQLQSINQLAEQSHIRDRMSHSSEDGGRRCSAFTMLIRSLN